MPAPDYARGAWVSKRGTRVKHIGVIDRRQLWVPWRPLCNANMLEEMIDFVSSGSSPDWFVDMNPRAWNGRTVCKNCIRVVEELNQMLHGTDPNTEQEAPALGQGDIVTEWPSVDLGGEG